MDKEEQVSIRDQLVRGIKATSLVVSSYEILLSFYLRLIHCAARMFLLIGGIVLLSAEVPTKFLAWLNMTLILERKPINISLVFHWLAFPLFLHLKKKVNQIMSHNDMIY